MCNRVCQQDDGQLGGPLGSGNAVRVDDHGIVATCDTEMGYRLAAQGQARLASSVHIVCRPRENPDGSLREEAGEWRDVLSELPERIHQWMPRLAAEGVVGADAIFSCLGPALEIFSRYSRVEKASGERTTTRVSGTGLGRRIDRSAVDDFQ